MEPDTSSGSRAWLVTSLMYAMLLSPALAHARQGLDLWQAAEKIGRSPAEADTEDDISPDLHSLNQWPELRRPTLQEILPHKYVVDQNPGIQKFSRNRFHDLRELHAGVIGGDPEEDLDESTRVHYQARIPLHRGTSGTLRLGSDEPEPSRVIGPVNKLWRALENMNHRRIQEEGDRKLKRFPPPPPGFHAIRGK